MEGQGQARHSSRPQVGGLPWVPGTLAVVGAVMMHVFWLLTMMVFG